MCVKIFFVECLEVCVDVLLTLILELVFFFNLIASLGIILYLNIFYVHSIEQCTYKICT